MLQNVLIQGEMEVCWTSKEADSDLKSLEEKNRVILNTIKSLLVVGDDGKAAAAAAARI